jgi:CBS domain-containing protein
MRTFQHLGNLQESNKCTNRRTLAGREPADAFGDQPSGQPMSEEIEQAEARQLALQAVLQKTRVSALTLSRVPILSPEQSLEEAAEQMREVSHGSALICEDNRLLGIVTERDLLRLLAEEVDFDAPVSRHMTLTPRTLSPDDRLAYAVLLMDRGGYRRLPVVDDDRCAAGMIDVKTVMNYLVDQVPTTVYNQASSALLSVRHAEGA